MKREQDRRIGRRARESKHDGFVWQSLGEEEEEEEKEEEMTCDQLTAAVVPHPPAGKRQGNRE